MTEPNILPGDDALDLVGAIRAKAAQLRAAEQSVRDAKALVKTLKDEIRGTRKQITAALATGVKIKRKPKTDEEKAEKAATKKKTKD